MQKKKTFNVLFKAGQLSCNENNFSQLPNIIFTVIWLHAKALGENKLFEKLEQKW